LLLGIERDLMEDVDRCELSDIKPHDFRRYVGTELAKKDLRLAQNQLTTSNQSTHKHSSILSSIYGLPGEPQRPQQ